MRRNRRRLNKIFEELLKSTLAVNIRLPDINGIQLYQILKIINKN